MKLSIILPTRNEEQLIKNTLLDIDNFLTKKKRRYEILVVVNGSTDKTLEIVEKISNKKRTIKCLKSKLGYGYALRKGLKEANGDYIAIFNVDFYDLRLLDLTEIDLMGKDVVLGSKMTYWSTDNRPKLRKLISRALNLFLRIEFGFRGSDTHGIKIIRGKVAKKILKKCKTFSGIFDTEFVLRLQYGNFKIMDFPVNISELRNPRFVNRVLETPLDMLKLFKALK